MKSILKDAPKIETPRSYPYLGEYKGLVVLFKSIDTGMVIRGDDIHSMGDYRKDWDESQLTPLPIGQEIVLSNQGS